MTLKIYGSPRSRTMRTLWIAEELQLDYEHIPVAWDDPWLESLDLEYHNLDTSRGLFHALPSPDDVAAFNRDAFNADALRIAPSDTRACGRGLAVGHFLATRTPCIVNWDSLTIGENKAFPMPDPLATYDAEVRLALA